MSVGEDAEDPRVYGQVNPIIIKKGQVIEMVINNFANGHHPFHLHGHVFQVIARGSFNEGSYSPEKKKEKALAFAPMRRDTVSMDANTWAVVRFKADRAGVWLMHCHIEWHVNMGMTVTFIESPLELQKTLKIPQKHIDLCKAQCIKTEGNAAGRKDDHFNLEGARFLPDYPDHG
jgi:iron transport multicopper oxidase